MSIWNANEGLTAIMIHEFKLTINFVLCILSYPDNCIVKKYFKKIKYTTRMISIKIDEEMWQMPPWKFSKATKREGK